ncbi:hypothetical protein, partial [Serratia sp. ME43]|uniref:hypothetical protein n=1 Tax=Serratia sp. ME43 TaxID=2744256 RepID=UPI0015F77AB2
ERGLTLNTVMQGIWALQLAGCCGHQDVVFGSPVSGRFGQIDTVVITARKISICRKEMLCMTRLLDCRESYIINE